MAITAENLAKRYGIAREACDEFALTSQSKALEAQSSGYFAEEIVPVEVPGPKGTKITVDRDEGPRSGLSMEKLGKLPARFVKDGVVTPGNASGFTDGAAAVVLTTVKQAKADGLSWIGRLIGSGVVGVDPAIMGIGPAFSIPKALQRAGIGERDLAVMEINEAFAPQVLACLREMHSATNACASIPTAAPSRSGIRSAHPAPASRLPRSTTFERMAADMVLPRRASAADKASRPRSSWSDPAGAGEVPALGRPVVGRFGDPAGGLRGLENLRRAASVRGRRSRPTRAARELRTARRRHVPRRRSTRTPAVSRFFRFVVRAVQNRAADGGTMGGAASGRSRRAGRRRGTARRWPPRSRAVTASRTYRSMSAATLAGSSRSLGFPPSWSSIRRAASVPVGKASTPPSGWRFRMRKRS